MLCSSAAAFQHQHATSLSNQQVAGIPEATARQRFHIFLCGPAHHIAVRLSFLRSRGKLRSLQGLTPRLFEVRGGCFRSNERVF